MIEGTDDPGEAMGDELDALLAGRASDDERLAGLLRTARRRLTDPPPAASRARHLQAVHAAAGELAGPSLRQRLRAALSTMAPPVRPALGVAVATIVVLAALAVGGGLPGPVQETVADAARIVGVDLPRPVEPAPPPTDRDREIPDGDDTTTGAPPADETDPAPAPPGDAPDGEGVAPRVPAEADERGDAGTDRGAERDRRDGGTDPDGPAEGDAPARQDRDRDSGRRSPDRAADEDRPAADRRPPQPQDGGDGRPPDPEQAPDSPSDRDGAAGDHPGGPASTPVPSESPAAQQPEDGPADLIPEVELPTDGSGGSDQQAAGSSGSPPASDDPVPDSRASSVDSDETAGGTDRS